MPKPSKRADAMPASPIRRLVPYADAAKTRGVHVHHLNIGQPDIATPKGMIEAYRNYDDKVLAYGPSQGLPEMREVVADYFRKLGFDIEARHVSTTVGGSEAVRFAMDAVTDPGDEVLVCEPFYANYAGFAVSSGAKVVPVPASADDGFHLPADEVFEARITERTKALIVCSPGNPTGTVYSKAEMHRLAALADKHDLYIISDEVYREFAYDGVEVTSSLALPGADDRVIVIDSVSKRYSACGARVGFVITRNEAVLDAVMRMCFARLCPATVDQLAAIAAYKTPQSYFDEVVAEYQARRDALVSGLNAIDGCSTYKPEGAFYTVATFDVKDADHFAQWLLTDFSHEGETVMMAPASGFYGTEGLGQNQARIAYVLEVKALEASVRVLEAALAAYPGRA